MSGLSPTARLLLTRAPDRLRFPLLFYAVLLCATTANADPAGNTAPEDAIPLQSLPIEYYVERGLIPERSSRLEARRLAAGAEDWMTSEHAQVVNVPTTYTLDLRGVSEVDNSWIKIENIGDVDVLDPWIVLNHERDWFDIPSILEEGLEGDTDPRRKAFRIWQFLKKNRYHWYPAEGTYEVHSPTKFLNVYGYGFCDDSASNAVRLFKSAGMTQARCWGISGHVIPEVYFDGAWRMLDPDLEVFYPDADNETVAGVEACASNGWLVRRVSGSDIEALYTTTSDNFTYQNNWSGPATMSMRLRPGERLERHWRNWGKYHDNLYHFEPPEYGNGRQQYAPDLGDNRFKSGFAPLAGIETVTDSGATPNVHLSQAGGTGVMVCSMQSAYVFVGGQIDLDVIAASAADNVLVEFSKGGGVWSPVGGKTGPFSGSWSLNLDSAVATTSTDACYQFWVRFTLTGVEKTSIGFNSLSITGDIQCAPASLPALKPGIRNSASVRFSASAPAALRVTHQWNERYYIPPPKPPTDEPGNPSDAKVVTTAPVLSWSDFRTTSTITAHEIMVSWGPRGIVPVSPLLWRQSGATTSWCVPDGWLLEDRTYYWRVRARDQNGQWSTWSEPWRFEVVEPQALLVGWKVY